MSIFPTLIETRDRTCTTGGLDALDDFWYNIAGTGTKSGVTISEKTALKYLTVARCVMLISADLARLPLILYKKYPNGSKERVLDHPLYDIMHNKPNPETNSFLWRESGSGHVELWGNHYSSIQRHPITGDIQALWQIENPGTVTVKRDQKGNIYYEWYSRFGRSVSNNVDLESLGGGIQKIQKYKKDVFHVPGFGFNGLIGLSTIGIIRESVGLGLANDEFASRYFSNGMHIGGVMNVPHDLGDKKDEYLAALKKEYGGLAESHGVLVTQNDETFTQLKMPLKDAQFLEGRRFQKTELCGFYGVPPHKVGIHEKNANRSNLEQENQNYVDGCLIHRIVRNETCMSNQLLTQAERKEGLFFEYLVDGLLRGDSQARAEYYNKIFQIGGISPNEIRAKENMNPDPSDAADQKYVMLNMVPLEQAGDLAAPVKPEEKSVRSLIEYRSLVARDRITRQYMPLFLKAAERIINLEGNAVKNKVAKFRKLRAKSDMEKWLDGFYRDMPAKIKRELGPVFRSFSEAIIAESVTELGIESVNLDKFVSDYIDTYALRHTSSSHGQLVSLLEGELDDLEVRVDEWSEKRPDKIARNETIRASNAVYQAVAFSAGFSTVWRIRGAKTCKFCREFNGKRVASGQSFVNDGDEVSPKGETPMKIRGMKTHPPLHQGCDCYLGIA